MKEPLSFEKGRVVQSTQGRDRGNYFLVTEEAGEGLVMIADGDLHRLDHPKRKKIKHLRAKPVLIDFGTIRPEGGKVQDSDIRKALEAHGFTRERSLRKEG